MRMRVPTVMQSLTSHSSSWSHDCRQSTTLLSTNLLNCNPLSSSSSLSRMPFNLSFICTSDRAMIIKEKSHLFMVEFEVLHQLWTRKLLSMCIREWTAAAEFQISALLWRSTPRHSASFLICFWEWNCPNIHYWCMISLWSILWSTCNDLAVLFCLWRLIWQRYVVFEYLTVHPMNQLFVWMWRHIVWFVR